MKRRYVPIIAAGLAGTAVLYCCIADKLSCLLHTWSGLYCPGCGSTRAVHALFHGNIGEMFRQNFMLLPTAFFLTWLVFRKKNCPVPAVLWLGLLALFTVLRNLPSDPFTLAPY